MAATTADYFAAARQLLADGDPREVTIDAFAQIARPRVGGHMRRSGRKLHFDRTGIASHRRLDGSAMVGEGELVRHDHLRRERSCLQQLQGQIELVLILLASAVGGGPDEVDFA